MPGGTSVEAFLRFVNERFQDFKCRLTELMRVLPLEDLNEKASKAAATLDRARLLRGALAERDRPAWLAPIESSFQQYCGSPRDQNLAVRLLETVARFFPAIDDHKWAFDFSGDEPFDFDGVYERFRAESRIPELFDKLIELLEQIVQSEEIDSRKIIQTLQTIIATLKKNRTGSYFSLIGTWTFVRSYLKNVAWEVISNVQVLGPLIAALRKTLEELDTNVCDLHQKMVSELQPKLTAEFPKIVYAPLGLPPPPSASPIEDDNKSRG